MTVADQIRRHRAAEATVTVVDEAGAAARGPGGRRRPAAAPVPVRRHRLRPRRPRERGARRRAPGRRRAVGRGLPRPVRLRDPAVLLGPLRARPRPARHRPHPRRRPAGSSTAACSSRATRCAGTPSRPTGCWTCRSRRSSTSQLARIRRDVADFAGLIDTWDVINEVVIMPVFDRGENGITRMAQRLGRVGIVAATFEAARETNPGGHAAAQRLRHVRRLRAPDRGLPRGRHPDRRPRAPVTHAPGLVGRREDAGRPRSVRALRAAAPLHRDHARVGPPDAARDRRPQRLPGDRVADRRPTARRARPTRSRRTTRRCWPHPAVEAITWWGFPDGGWLNAPTGLVRADGSPKPAYDRLHGLVKGEWWLPPTTMRTDELGRIRLSRVPRRLRGHVARPDGRVLPRCPRIRRGRRDPESMTGASRRPSMCRLVSVGGC